MDTLRKGLILAVCIIGTAQADISVTFDFNGATVGGASPDYVASANERVTDYMTAEYRSDVTATGAAAWNNGETAPLDLDWPGKTSTDNWLRTYGSASLTPGVFQISFDTVPIVGAGADFYVFTLTEGHDFTVRAYDSSYGDRYNPSASALVAEEFRSFDIVGSGLFTMNFDEPVSLLVFSDGGWYDIAIDNLAVVAIPLPAAAILGILGLCAAGLKLRKFV